MGTTDEIHELGRRWADAEQRDDASALAALSSDDHMSPIAGPPPAAG